MIASVATNRLEGEVMDVSIKFRGEEEDELPERILCSHRYVQLSFYKCALATDCALNHRQRSVPLTLANPQPEIPSTFQVLVGALFVYPFMAMIRACAEAIGVGNRDNPVQFNGSSLPVQPRGHHRGRKPAIIATNDPFEKAVNKLIQLLEDVRIPIRREVPRRPATTNQGSGRHGVVPLGSAPSAGEALATRDDLRQVSILRVLSRHDLLRFFVASDCSFKKATVRIVESAAWRGLTFPVDLRSCRVELQSGQFFQQGRDLEGRPVFYFRNMCKGPWRGEEDAVIAAVVHRLERALVEFARDDPDVRCTLIVLSGKPRRKGKKNDDSVASQSSNGSLANQESVEGDEMVADDEQEDLFEESSADEAVNKLQRVANYDNPRVPQSEKYYVHSSDQLLRRLIKLVMLHYPERLYRALVVKGNGGARGSRTVIGSIIQLSSFVGSASTRRKVKFFRRRADLQRYVDKKQLIELAGGEAAISPSAFDIN